MKLKRNQILIIICFIITSIFYFPWYRLERSVVTSEYIERLNRFKEKVISDYDLSTDGSFKSEVIYFDVCSFSYRLFSIGYREKELIFFMDYQESSATKTRHFVKVDIITPNFIFAFLSFSSYIVLMGSVLLMCFSLPNIEVFLKEMKE